MKKRLKDSAYRREILREAGQPLSVPLQNPFILIGKKNSKVSLLSVWFDDLLFFYLLYFMVCLNHAIHSSPNTLQFIHLLLLFSWFFFVGKKVSK